MSHASLLLALRPEDLICAGMDGDAAIAYQMEPFDENGQWLKNGSRWDWYVVGGRFTGKLDGYDPSEDPRNFEPCKRCQATGKRKDMVVANGCNGCDGTGVSRKWKNAPHKGDAMFRKDLNMGMLGQAREKRLRECYALALKNNLDEETSGMIYGVIPSTETLDDYLHRANETPGQAVSHYAFLSNRHWHEGERLGWFGSRATTECEAIERGNAASNDIDNEVAAMLRKCLHKDKKTGARLVVWNEPQEIWSKEFYRRFVERLSEDTLLVTIDYHV